MYANVLVRVPGRATGLPRDGTVIVLNVGVEATVPTSLHADIWVVEGFEIQVIDRARGPDVGSVAIDYFGDGVAVVDVEDVPLCTPSALQYDKGLKGCERTAAVSFRAKATAAMGVPFFASTATTSVASPPLHSPLLSSCIERI